MRRGSAVPFVPMTTFAELEVPLPSIEMQNLIAGIQRLSLQEQNLLRQIREHRRVLIEGLLTEAVRREAN
jgi:restriction endonuclease S subunit